MKKFSFFAAALLLLSVFANATIRRVGFFGTPITGVDYNTLQLAHDASAVGDTIMMMPGSSLAGNISKVLVIIGPGYFLDPASTTTPGNSGLQANVNSNAIVGSSLVFQTGSNGSQVLGCTMGSNVSSNVGVGNLLFKRCYFYYGFFFSGNSSGTTFQQCFFDTQINSSSYTVTNISFLNCIIGNSVNLSGGPTSGLFSNCVFSPSGVSLGAGAWQVQNSISQGVFSGTNVIYNNDIGTATQFPTGNGNQQNKAWAIIFNLTGSRDGQFILKAGSPAIGAGVLGSGATDCGLFGGATPYRLSGIPSVPTIYALTSPQGTVPAGNSVQINLSTRSNN